MVSPLHMPEVNDRDLAAIVRMVYEKSGITLHAGTAPIGNGMTKQR